MNARAPSVRTSLVFVDYTVTNERGSSKRETEEGPFQSMEFCLLYFSIQFLPRKYCQLHNGRYDVLVHDKNSNNSTRAQLSWYVDRFHGRILCLAVRKIWNYGCVRIGRCIVLENWEYCFLEEEILGVSFKVHTESSMDFYTIFLEIFEMP